MAQIDDYWKKLNENPTFQGLPDDQKEAGRQRFFEKFIVNSRTYQESPEDRRNAIRSDFDKRIALPKPRPSPIPGQALEAAGTGIEEAGRVLGKTGKVLGEGVEKVGKEVGSSILKGREALIEATQIEPIKKLKLAARIGTEAAQQMVEGDQPGPLRLAASGAIGFSHGFENMIPNSGWEVLEYALTPAIMKAAGKGIMGLPVKQAIGLRSAMPPSARTIAHEMTAIKLEEAGKLVSDVPENALREVSLAEEKARYEKWLGDHSEKVVQEEFPESVHPEFKTNHSQLIDEAKVRLQRVKDESMHLRQVAEEEQRMARPPQLGPGPQPAGLLPETIRRPGTYRQPGMIPLGPTDLPPPEVPPGTPPVAGTPPNAPPSGRPAPVKPVPRQPAPSVSSPVAMGEVGSKGHIAYFKQAFAERFPGDTDAVHQEMAENAWNGLTRSTKSQPAFFNRSNPGPLDKTRGKFLDTVADGWLAKHQEARALELSRESEVKRLAEKNMTLENVEVEAQRLQKIDMDRRQDLIDRKNDFTNRVGKFSLPKEDPMTGKIPEAEENSAIPKQWIDSSARPMDEAAQLAHEEGFIPEPTSNALREYLKKFELPGRIRHLTDYMHEAEGNLESGSINEPSPPEFGKPPQKGPKQQDLIPEADTFQLGGERGEVGGPVEGTPPQERIPGTQPTFDNTQRPVRNLLSDINRDIGETGGVGGELDPVARARLRANLRELMRRAKEAGMESTEDIMAYAAAHAADMPIGKVLRAEIKKTPSLNQVEEWPAKEMQAVMDGNPTAKKSLYERAMYQYKKYDFGKKESHKLVWRQSGDENTLGLRSYFVRHDALKDMSATESAALHFVMEDKIPSLEAYSKLEPKAAEIIHQAQNPTQRMKDAVELLRPYENDKRLVLNSLGDDVDYKKDYLHHRWEHRNDVANWIDQRRGTADPFAKESVFDKYADGIEAGFKMKSNDFRENMTATDRMRNRLISRYRLRSWMENAKTFEGKKALLPETEAPPEYQRMEGKIWKTTVKDFKGTRDVRMAVAPDYKHLIKYVYDHPNDAWWIKGAAKYNALSKGANLALSLFHGQSLALDMTTSNMTVKQALGISKKFPWIHPSESSVTRIVAGIGKSIKAEVGPLPEGFEKMGSMKQFAVRARQYGKAYLEGNPLLQHRETALDAAEHNVVFDSIPDLEYNLLSNTLEKAARMVEKVDPKYGFVPAFPFRAVGTGIKANYKGIFTYIRNMGAIVSYENLLAENLKKFPKLPVEEVKNATGRWVSKSYGGAAFVALMATPKMVQFFHLTQFAPDWFYSTWMREGAAASGAIRSAPGLLRGKGFKDPEARMATLWMARLAVSYAVIGNLTNYAMWKFYTGKGRFMWENEPGHELEIFWGYYPSEKDPSKPGRIKWLVGGRGFTDPYEAYMDPAKYLRGRKAPIFTALGKVVFGVEGAGYTAPEYMTTGEKTAKFIKNATWPLSFTGNSVAFTWPTKLGEGPRKAMDLFFQSYETKNPKYRQQAIKWGNENHLGGSLLEAMDKKALDKWNYIQYKRRQKQQKALLK